MHLFKDFHDLMEAIRSLPPSDFLNTPRQPTKADMDRHSRIEDVPLSMVRRTQKKMDRKSFDVGEYGNALISGYDSHPVAVRMNDGEYLVFDGHHRTVSAINDGDRNMKMFVLDAKDYDPQNAGRSKGNDTIDDEELLKQLGL